MILKDIDVFILAGGLGSRLGNLTQDIPKPLLDVAGKPFICYLLKQLADHGAKNVIISIGYKKEKFYDILNDENTYGLNIQYCEEDVPLGTGGALKKAIKNNQISSDYIFVMNGDTYIDFNINQYIADSIDDHYYNNSIVVHNIGRENKRYGKIDFLIGSNEIVNLNATDPIENFMSEQRGYFINSGRYLLSINDFEQFSECDTAQFISLENTIFKNMISKKYIRAFDINTADFIDIGIPEDYEKAQELFKGRL